MRLDKFLKVSRILKRRTVANEACEGQRVTVNGKTAKPAHTLKPGDIVSIRFGDRQLTIRVLELAQHVKKEQADGMYEVISQ